MAYKGKEYLKNKLALKRTRVSLRYKYYEMKQHTVEICEFFDLNPYKLVSGGSLLIATEDGNALVRTLEQEGIPSVVIGKATDSNDRVLINGEERRFLETTQT